jgi:hypothetical protein
MAQKYPSDNVPYRFRREVVDCCYSHRRWDRPKVRYATREEAAAEAQRLGGMVIVPCRNAEGFHLKTKRKRDAQ